MRKVLITSVIILSVLSLPLTKAGVIGAVKNSVDITDPTYIIAGLDDAAGNTDFLMLVHYDSKDNTLSFMQIPRDTYYNDGRSSGKINSIYSSLISRGKTPNEAMDMLELFLSDNLGIRIDGYVSYTVDAFARLVDAIGGVEVNMPYPITVKDRDGRVRLELTEGRNTLSGEEASVFVRHRSTYKTQDLGRLDAQKIFLSSFLRSFRTSFGPEMSLKFLLDGGDGVTTNLQVGDFVGLLIKNRGRISSMKLKCATVPGSAVLLDGKISYYSLSRAALDRLLDEFSIVRQGKLDPYRIFRCNAEEDFYSIYDSDVIDYKIYGEEELSSLVPK